MFRQTTASLVRGQYSLRLKTRMVGFVPKVNFRKVKGCFVSFRSEANTARSFPYVKSTEERLENAGKKMAKVAPDDILGKYVVFREGKLKGPFATKASIAPKVQWPKK